MSSPVVRRERPSDGIPIPAAVALVCALVGCASDPAPPPRNAGHASRSGLVRLVWLPLEPLAAPGIAGPANDSLAKVMVPWATQSSRAPVSMEVAQLTIECIQPTPACHAAVGRSLSADRLLWIEVKQAAPDAPAVKIALELFDVGEGASVRRADRTFKDGAEAGTGIGAFIEGALGGRPPTTVAAKAASP